MPRMDLRIYCFREVPDAGKTYCMDCCLKQVEGEDYLISLGTKRDFFNYYFFLPLFNMINLCLLCLFFQSTKSGFFTSFWLIAWRTSPKIILIFSKCTSSSVFVSLSVQFPTLCQHNQNEVEQIFIHSFQGVYG